MYHIQCGVWFSKDSSPFDGTLLFSLKVKAKPEKQDSEGDMFCKAGVKLGAPQHSFSHNQQSFSALVLSLPIEQLSRFWQEAQRTWCLPEWLITQKEEFFDKVMRGTTVLLWEDSSLLLVTLLDYSSM